MIARLITLIVISYTNPVFAHGGRTNSEGCHTQSSTGEYHCHRRTGAIANQAKQIKKDENYFNALLARSLGAKAETKYNYRWDNGSSFVRVDVETEQFVIEGGLDKRSSLDSVQQALFAATLSGKKPAIVIYDTDGVEGKFEFRIRQAARKAGVTYRRWTEQQIRAVRSFP